MVKRIIQIQLRPTPDQAAALEATGRFHQACNWVAQRAFEHKLANRYALHKRYYYAVRQQCAECGHVERANRCSQSEFCCRRCGLKVHADVNAARTDHPSQESVSTRP